MGMMTWCSRAVCCYCIICMRKKRNFVFEFTKKKTPNSMVVLSPSRNVVLLRCSTQDIMLYKKNGIRRKGDENSVDSTRNADDIRVINRDAHASDARKL